jgi:hypothetical protein
LLHSDQTLSWQYFRNVDNFSSKSAGKFWHTVVLALIDSCFRLMKRRHHDGPAVKSVMENSWAMATAFSRICVVLTPRSEALCSSTQVSILSSSAGHLAFWPRWLFNSSRSCYQYGRGAINFRSTYESYCRKNWFVHHQHKNNRPREG